MSSCPTRSRGEPVRFRSPSLPHLGPLCPQVQLERERFGKAKVSMPQRNRACNVSCGSGGEGGREIALLAEYATGNVGLLSLAVAGVCSPSIEAGEEGKGGAVCRKRPATYVPTLLGQGGPPCPWRLPKGACPEIVPPSSGHAYAGPLDFTTRYFSRHFTRGSSLVGPTRLHTRHRSADVIRSGSSHTSA